MMWNTTTSLLFWYLRFLRLLLLLFILLLSPVVVIFIIGAIAAEQQQQQLNHDGVVGIQSMFFENNELFSSLRHDTTVLDDAKYVTDNNNNNNNNNNRHHHKYSSHQDWYYVYEPTYFPLPPEVSIENAHGIAIDPLDNNTTIIITYQDTKNDSQCLLRWNINQYQTVGELIGPGSSLCQGVPHGLRGEIEYDTMMQRNRTVLYHANNQQVLHKTTINGEILWTVQGSPSPNNSKSRNDTSLYSPTWFAAAPESVSPYIYLVDGYGSNHIYVYYRSNGTYTGHCFGGIGMEHGWFHTNHAITYDWRIGNMMIICDRENHRLEFFIINPQDPSIFVYNHTIPYNHTIVGSSILLSSDTTTTTTTTTLLQQPCNIRFRPEDGYGIIPFLDGYVGIVNHVNELIHVVNITDMIGPDGFLHPHDAHFIPGTSGDFILVTWNPGRIGYLRNVTSNTATTF
jgi:hypothetical protein